MKQRILTGILGSAFMIVVFALHNTIVLNIVLMLVCVIATYECLKSTRYVRNQAIFISSLVYSLLPAYFPLFDFKIGLIVTILYIGTLFAIALKCNETIKLAELSFAFTMTLVINLSWMLLGVFGRIDDVYPETYQNVDAIFMLLVTFGGAWFCDMGAYFVGSFYGKHKLAPVISPKKTIEGAVGGVITNIILLILLGFIWKLFMFTPSQSIQWIPLIILAIITSFVGMFGDLVFSMIKRKCNIKDYGNLIKGHGGVLDRFDSVITVTPVVFLFIQFFHLLER